MYYQNFYGLDIPTKEELIGHNKSIKEIEDILKIDKLIYQSIEDVSQAVYDLNPYLTSFELSVFNGEYLH